MVGFFLADFLIDVRVGGLSGRGDLHQQKAQRQDETVGQLQHFQILQDRIKIIFGREKENHSFHCWPTKFDAPLPASHNKEFADLSSFHKERTSRMSSVVSPVARGVPPIRAGQGHSFLLRRLHSLSGIVPVGAFLVEHFVSNAFATNGPHAYAAQVKFLTGLPFVPVLETVGIYIPLLYHSLYGFYIWFRGESNVTDYPWAGNFMYSAQRWTGLITFLYIGWHTY